MKNTLLLALLTTGSSFIASAQFDSALRYRMVSPTFEAAADSLIALAAASPADTGEGGALDQLMIFQKMWGECFLP